MLNKTGLRAYLGTINCEMSVLYSVDLFKIHCVLEVVIKQFLKTVFQCAIASPLPGCNALLLHMSSTMWYIMQSIQSKYSLSERLIRTIAAIRSFPHDNVEDLIRKVGLLIFQSK